MGFWAILAALLVLLFAGRSVIKKTSGKVYLGQILVIMALAFLSLVFLVMTIWFPVRGEVSAAVVPRIWIAGIFACLIYLFIHILRKTEDPDEPAGDVGLSFKFMGITLAYIVLMVLVGYFIASLCFLAATMTLLSYRRPLVILAISFGWMLFSYLVFFRVLFVPLPRGILINALFG